MHCLLHSDLALWGSGQGVDGVYFPIRCCANGEGVRPPIASDNIAGLHAAILPRNSMPAKDLRYASRWQIYCHWPRAALLKPNQRVMGCRDLHLQQRRDRAARNGQFVNRHANLIPYRCSTTVTRSASPSMRSTPITVADFPAASPMR